MAQDHSSFVGFLLRARNIRRWPLMSQFVEERLDSHIYQAAAIGHLLGAIEVAVYGNDEVDPDKVSAMATFHEASEIAGMGDVPSPVKYIDPETTALMKRLEGVFERRLLGSLPTELQAFYQPYIEQDKVDIHVQLAKAADVICAYLKCAFELDKGNKEFHKSMQEMEKQLAAFKERYRSVEYFAKIFMGDALLTIDEQAKDMAWIENANKVHID
ncbi:5'-deoxynucleotidase [Aestuariibacter halophilus]|uniref:5'-deoxynucleotidase n=1 Tax=Fluctibacter halophilus TaxID=226011 RepID=A0ABS8GBZ1_9ALTE|nr:5'-deoxynucleotidase [Aestuariibacter halophilus]MCC2618013.1 5'-deoxynucleotidase [Aestuariibacter halophilus]